MEAMSQINKYEITTLYGKYEEKHIINALTAQDAIVQFKVKMNNDRYKIYNIEPWIQVWTGEQIIKMSELLKNRNERKQNNAQVLCGSALLASLGSSKTEFNRIKRFVSSFWPSK